MCIIVMVDYVLLALLDYFSPRDRVERAPKFDLERWKEVRLVDRLSFPLPCVQLALTETCAP